jgi:hypothetical protein
MRICVTASNPQEWDILEKNGHSMTFFLNNPNEDEDDQISTRAHEECAILLFYTDVLIVDLYTATLESWCQVGMAYALNIPIIIYEPSIPGDVSSATVNYRLNKFLFLPGLKRLKTRLEVVELLSQKRSPWKGPESFQMGGRRLLSIGKFNDKTIEGQFVVLTTIPKQHLGYKTGYFFPSTEEGVLKKDAEEITPEGDIPPGYNFILFTGHPFLHDCYTIERSSQKVL